MASKDPQQKVYNNVDTDVQRTPFDLGFSNSLTCNFGKMIPTLCKEAVPKDHWKVSTDFWSRFLPLQAPVFQKIDFRFNNFFVPNELIWKGWAQFFGDGDGQSADYLLSDHTRLATSKVPYITTKGFAEMLCGKSLIDPETGLHFKYANQMWLSVGRDAVNPDTVDYRYSVYCHIQDYKAYWVPFLCSNKVTLGHVDTSNDPLLARICLMLLPTSDVVDKFEKDGLILCAEGVTSKEFYFWRNSNRIHNGDTVFVYKNFQLTEDIVDDHNYLYVDYDWIGLSYMNYGVRVAEVSEYESADAWNSEDFRILVDPAYDAEVHLPDNDICVADFVFCCDCNSGIPITTEEGYLQDDWALVASPFVLFSSDFSNGSTGYIFGANGVDGYSEWYYLQIAHRFVAHFFGKNSLSDYLGCRKSQFGKRQDLRPDKPNKFETYQYIINTHNTDMPIAYYYGGVQDISGAEYSVSSKVVGGKRSLGTYSEPTEDEIGIVNDEPISLLPYLAYKKIWTDFIRDPRFELRDPYSDPYRSPFLIPFSDGTYISGDVLQFVNASMFNREPSQIDTQCVFTYQTLFSFFSLIERRIVQDGFTLMSPNSQYGDEISVSGSVARSMSDGNNISGSGPLYWKGDGTPDNVRVQTNSGRLMNESSSFGIKLLRLMGRLQKYMEQKNFYGSDYIKEILAQYNIEPSHCQNCSVTYLGGKTFNPGIQQIPVQSADSPDTSQVTGQLSANLELNGRVPDFSFTATEHGYVIQLMTVQNDFKSCQGVRSQRIDKFDFGMPNFANLGMQQVKYSRVLDSDIYDWAPSGSVEPDDVFAYEPRYADYKYSLDEIHGEMCSSLSYWVSQRRFNPNALGGLFGYGDSSNVLELGKNFLYENPDYNAFAYSDDNEHHVIMDMHHYISCVRSFPMLPNPTIV